MTDVSRFLGQLVERLARWTGLDLERGSAHVALARYLEARLDAHQPGALARYVDGLVSPHQPEAVHLVDAITVCHSSFYRDPDQLAAIGAVLAGDLSRPASIWVPACATGEDAYSIALVAEAVGRRAAILATDINSRAIAHAMRGEYGAWSVRELPAALALPRRPDGLYEVPARLRHAISFARHNLMDAAPPCPEGWDVIVCRNVFMYLARPRVAEVLQRFAAALRPGGYLFLGAGDVIDRPPPPLQLVRIEQRHALWRPLSGAECAEVCDDAAKAPPPGTAPPAAVMSALRAVAAAVPALAAPPAPLPRRSPRRPAASSTPPFAPAGAPPSEPPEPLAPRPDATPVPGAVPGAPPPRPDATPVPGAGPLAPPPPEATPVPGARPFAAELVESLALLERADTQAALQLLLRVLEVDPLCMEARLLAGIAYHLEGDALQAARALRGALVLSPTLWPAEMYLGFALAKLGDEDGAARALRRGGALAARAERLPLSPAVAAWLEGWRVDAIAMGRRAGTRAP